MKIFIATAGMMLSTIIFGQTTASATPSTYLSSLRNDSEYTYNGSDAAFLKLGFGICYDILDGVSIPQIVSNITENGNHTEDSAKRIIAYALINLCNDPGTIKVAPAENAPIGGKRLV